MILFGTAERREYQGGKKNEGSRLCLGSHSSGGGGLEKISETGGRPRFSSERVNL